jgi:hypothetical protein
MLGFSIFQRSHKAGEKIWPIQVLNNSPFNLMKDRIEPVQSFNYLPGLVEYQIFRKATSLRESRRPTYIVSKIGDLDSAICINGQQES